MNYLKVPVKKFKKFSTLLNDWGGCNKINGGELYILISKKRNYYEENT